MFSRTVPALTAAALLSLIFLAGLAGVARADVVAEYLFWREIGKASGKAMSSYLDYQQERQLWDKNIADAKDELRRCGGCPEAQAKLNEWQGTVDTFNKFVGGVFQSVGMPPGVGKLFGIPPLSMPSAYDRGEGLISTPNWIKDAPEFCRVPSEAHLQCLKDFQKRTKQAQILAVISPGGSCYDSSKLFGFCAAKAYDAFRRELSLQEARASGQVIPEYILEPNMSKIYYGRVSEDLAPEMPPPEIVRELFAEGRSLEIYMDRPGPGQLTFVTIWPFRGAEANQPDFCDTSIGPGPNTEIGHRICSDYREIPWNMQNPLLFCDYTTTGGSHGSRTYSRVTYWYAQRPALAAPERLLQRSEKHSLLAVGDPRPSCPNTLRETQAIHQARLRSLDELKASVPQTPKEVVLPRYLPPRSEPRCNLSNLFLPLPGSYLAQFYPHENAKKVSSSCTIEKLTETQFRFSCVNERRRKSQAIGTIEGDAIVVAWSAKMTLVYRASEDCRGLRGKSEGQSWLDVMTRLPDAAEKAALQGPQGLTGRWLGTYVCSGKPIAAELLLEEVKSRLWGRLAFSAAADDKSIPSGSYYLLGTIDPPNRSINLDAQGWIVQPSRWVAVGISANYSSDGRELTGRLAGSGVCTDLVARRVESTAVGLGEMPQDIKVRLGLATQAK
jgi:hypothetical protein